MLIILVSLQPSFWSIQTLLIISKQNFKSPMAHDSLIGPCMMGDEGQRRLAQHVAQGQRAHPCSKYTRSTLAQGRGVLRVESFSGRGHILQVAAAGLTADTRGMLNPVVVLDHGSDSVRAGDAACVPPA